MLHSHNVLLKIFKSAIDNWPYNYKVVIHADRTPRGEHARRYNAPMVNEVAALVTDEPCSPRDIVLRAHDNTLQRIADAHKFYGQNTGRPGSAYLDALQLCLLPQLEESEPNDFIWQQDGAPPHWYLSVHD
ncbi:uncharacterized protein TNCV_1456631 [Trichonephila clavipes]|nr:uncharacterized protein TNCV_1456631 [Trichonephila clavipes]